MVANKGDEEDKKKAIIETAARLIRSDIKDTVNPIKDEYPKKGELKLDASLQYMPPSLRYLLELLFVGSETQRKIAGIGQSITQAVRPRASIAPLQLGLAVQIHHLFRSKFLIDTLNLMGFSSSYSEVQRFEKNAACSAGSDVLGDDIDLLDSMVLFAADNVDHNSITLDGKGTFHGMGMIVAVTPKKQMDRSIPRHKVSSLNVHETSKVAIIDYRFVRNHSRNVLYQSLPMLGADCDKGLDILWELSFNFKREIPNWQGMMHLMHQGCKHPGESSVSFLPMIDMYSGDMTCIQSTLEYICNIAMKYHIPPVITFDQLLFWKASEIVSNAPERSHLKEVVLLLGGFHTFMNLLGAIGTLMDGTGLKNLLEEVYGDNAVVHMPTGKSVQRAFRGNLLVDKCLNRLLVTKIVDNDPGFQHFVNKAEELYTAFLSGVKDAKSFLESECMVEMERKLNCEKSALSKASKTARLWLGYQRMVGIGQDLIRADRTGSWALHLCTVADCLPTHLCCCWAL
jgi:hypothetical protein